MRRMQAFNHFIFVRPPFIRRRYHNNVMIKWLDHRKKLPSKFYFNQYLLQVNLSAHPPLFRSVGHERSGPRGKVIIFRNSLNPVSPVQLPLDAHRKKFAETAPVPGAVHSMRPLTWDIRAMESCLEMRRKFQSAHGVAHRLQTEIRDYNARKTKALTLGCIELGRWSACLIPIHSHRRRVHCTVAHKLLWCAGAAPSQYKHASIAVSVRRTERIWADQ